MFEDLAFLEWLVLIMIGLLFFKEQLLSWIGNKLGFSNKEDSETPEWAERLIHYTNHDTTKMHEKTHERLEKVDDTLKEVSWTLKDIRENGIKCRISKE